METPKSISKENTLADSLQYVLKLQTNLGFAGLEASQDLGEKAWFSTGDPRSMISKTLRASVDTASFCWSRQSHPSPRDAPYGPRPPCP